MINDAQNRKISYMVERYIPTFILNEYPYFKDFLITYYEWCEQNDKFVPWNILRNIENWNDVDTSIEEFTDYFKNEYINIPADNWEFYIKHYKEIYQSKGSTSSLEFFIKILTGLDTTVEYPNRYLMKSSDGVYRSYKIIYCNKNININYQDYVSTTVIGAISTSTGIIESIEIYDNYIKVFLSHTTGDFVNEPIIFNNGVSFSTTMLNTLSKYEITNGGLNYQKDESIVASQYPTLKAKISSVYSGYLDNIIITNSGSNYQVGDVITFNCDRTDEYYALPFVSVTKVDNSGAILEVKILYRGYGLLKEPTINSIKTENGTGATFTLVSKNTGKIKSVVIESPVCNIDTSTFTFTINTTDGTGAVLTPIFGYEYVEPSYYYKAGSFLSDIFKLQDDYYYQEYSYVLNVAGNVIDKYRELFEKMFHPAGFAWFTNTVLENYINLYPYYENSEIEFIYDEDMLTTKLYNYIEMLHYSDRIIHNDILSTYRNTVLDDLGTNGDRVLNTFNFTGGSFVDSSLELITETETE